MSHAIAGSVMKGVHIHYKGPVDFPKVWKLINAWFEAKGFETLEAKAKHKVAPLGEELEVAIDAWRNITDYYRFTMRVIGKYWDGDYVEIVKDGKKVKMVNARFNFWISGQLVFDYADRFDKSEMAIKLRNFMEKYVLKWQWDAIYGDQLNYKILELQNYIKELLNMEVTGSEFADMW